MCAATRPISTRFEPVLALRRFDHWFLLSYTFPPCLPDPSRLVVPTRPVVVRAAPAFPNVSWVRLPSASADRCDGLQEGSFHPLTVKQRLAAHHRAPELAPVSRSGRVPSTCTPGNYAGIVARQLEPASPFGARVVDGVTQSKRSSSRPRMSSVSRTSRKIR